MPKISAAAGGTHAGVTQAETDVTLVKGNRLIVGDGGLRFRSDANTPPDIHVRRSAAGVLTIEGTIAVTDDITVADDVTITGDLTVTGTTTALGYLGAGGNVGLGSGASLIGFFGATPVAKPTVSGSRANVEQALADLLAELATLGLIVNSTTA